MGNLDPEVRSNTNTIQLLAAVKTDVLKNVGLKKILNPFLEDILKLQTGVSICVDGSMKNFKGSLLVCAGDTPASALLGWFKEATATYRPCRTCLANENDLKLYYVESA